MYAADFETTTDPNDCRVWAWGVAPVDDVESFEYSNDMDSFIEWCQGHNSMVYFHNLKFDGHFIIDYLLSNGFVHYEESTPYDKSFTSLISSANKVFSITIRWEDGHRTELRDSLKKLPMSVANVALAFGLETTKGEIDYDAYRPVGHELTSEELDYLFRDVKIVALALNQVIGEGMTGLTVASDSLREYKSLIGKKTFDNWFPVLSDSVDEHIREAYRGGFTYADKRFKSRKVGGGIVLDVNSLYPHVMREKMLPYGVPEYVEGRVEPTETRPLTIFTITFKAKLKPNKIPCIQVKKNVLYGASDYQTEIKEPVQMTMTSVDYELFSEHYEMDIISYDGGFRFKAMAGMFDEYVDKWAKVKETSTGGLKQIAKLHLNSLYGKFGSNPDVTGNVPVLVDGKVKFVKGTEKTKDPVYTAIAVFVTAYGRELTIRAAQAVYPVFAYADTDSLHLLSPDVPEGVTVHPTRMGAWKREYAFVSAFYVRAKAYLEQHEDGTYTNAFAGVPEDVSRTLTFDDLREGNVLHGKLIPESVPGGLVLKDVPYTIKL